jgi:uncharacterized protein (TIGR00288 family)
MRLSRPWWLRPTAEGVNEENREPDKPEISPTPSETSFQETAPEPMAAEPPVSQGTEPEPEPAWRVEAEEPPVEIIEEEEIAAAEPAPEVHAAERTEMIPVAEPEETQEIPVGEEASEAASPEAKRKRSRSRRRRKNGRGTAAAAAEPTDLEAADDEEEDDDLLHDDLLIDEPAPPPPAPRQAPSHRRPAHAAPPAVTPAPAPAPAPAPMARTFRGDTYSVPAGDVEAFSREIVISVPERQRTGSDERKIAMFCDLENVALGVRDSEISKFDITLVLERLLEKGKIIVKKAYADWERYSEYKRPFHESAIELIDIPQKFYSGKNSADIKMVVDAMDLSYSKEHLDTFVIVSGDSDFSPLVSKLKENNKYVIGIGVKNSSSNLLIDNCDEFIYYEDVWRDNQKGPKLDGLNKKTAEAFSLMIESIQALIRENKDVLWGSMIKQTMQRKKPSFNEGYYGYSTFSELLEDAERKQILKLKKDQRSGTYIVTGFAKNEPQGRR